MKLGMNLLLFQTRGDLAWIGTIGEVVAGILLVAMIIKVVQYFRDGAGSYEMIGGTEEETLKHISEWRTYIANKYLNAIAFWLDVEPTELEFKLTTPNMNINLLTIAKDNMEFNITFYWEDSEVVCHGYCYDGEEEYISKSLTLTIKDYEIDCAKMFDFVMFIKDTHDGFFTITQNEVEELWITSMAAVKNKTDEKVLFSTLEDFIILMRKKKNYKNKELLRVYTFIFGLILPDLETKKRFIEYLAQEGLVEDDREENIEEDK